ncbi:ATP-binding cassette domain-containing protein [Flammeovirga pectinis]|uniref:ATP-binding cassette domain-containing protein n=1 Tax=Flammeovirga pectinis TaxID=2494373 RepID=A0A3Q9FRR6_9BACT|nr:ATP-binding cassette domain-containing protein [Flammeovirga pectinis]AZQ64463.1 ATP-binding cassette domain-containing protein [Flammeovirga pectinis]
MIHTNQLKFTYPKGSEISFENFNLEAGNEMLIIGPSGCGKTTLLHLIGGLLQPTTGDIIINNKNIAQLKGQEMDSFRGKYIGIIFQKPHFARALTVGENLYFAQKVGGNKIDKERVKELLNRLGIIKHIDRSPQQMSEGEKQRLSVAMALINKPSILLADEPTASLDDTHATEVIKLLRELSSEENTALIIVTHDSRLKNEFKENILTLKSIQ